MSEREADEKIAAMVRSPRPMARPILVLDGYGDVGFGSSWVAGRIADVCDPHAAIVPISFAFCSDFESCRNHLTEVVDAHFPSADARETAPVDVIGLSFGGLVARYAACPAPATGKRLSIVHLYTISSPLAGAKVAELAGWTQLQRDVKPGAEFIRRLEASPANYELVCYTRLHDEVVGERLASPAGTPVLWVDTPAFGVPHSGAATDSRILADIERRLRNEAPLATQPYASLP